MSSVVILALGSRGDVEPHLALGPALQRAGFDVQVVAHADYATDVAAAGLPCSVVERTSVPTSGPLAHRYAAGLMGGTTAGMWAGLLGWSRQTADDVATSIRRACAPGDLVITGIAGIGPALALADGLGTQVVHVAFSATVPTSVGPSTAFAARADRVSPLNWASSVQAWRGALSLSLASGGALRERLGIGRIGQRETLRRSLALPTLVATSPLLAPPAHDWGDVTVTGSWRRPVDPSWAPSQRLVDFLDSGPEPVYVGFGSVVTSDPRGDIELLVEAARIARVRVVVRPSGSGAEDIPAVPVPASVHIVRDAPHDWLMPRMAAVVHHGGAGTTVAGLRAGVPSAVVSHGLDQPFHGLRLAQLGVGPTPLRRRGLTAARLAQLLTELTSGPIAAWYRERAAAAGDSVRAERGLDVTLDWLDERRLL
ncbi:MAG TPA: glycosyltransferase [Dermatophilaceae bacterium]|nr:glycosyltransferase [Dermatophilaceae bacterium]